MKIFIFFCLASIAYADKLGYNYQPVAHSNEGLSFTPGAQPRAAPSAPTQEAPALPAAIPATAQPAPAAAHPAPAATAAPAPAAPAITQYEKEFYTFTAPQAEFDDAAGHQTIANSLKKNLRVVFIKTPESKALENAALSLAKQGSEDKTAIYVLTKQADLGSLGQQLQAIQSQSSHKPEVHFIKYRTPQDATHAQQAIQQQYDSLPGSSHNSNEGTAPVLNFASQAPAAAVAAPAGPGNKYLPANPVPTPAYLPPSLRLFRH
ncbi:uncharacterized protein KIAA0754-like [Ceratitis capitata]|uniref:uncharacterized protein KIAA0754-like n=1 Tax=Ceratitis capitata TaxID=7213 RepID=UPI00032A0F7A|nr:uncharacterized protein KIAA0754-like [Ceratitis capitata]